MGHSVLRHLVTARVRATLLIAAVGVAAGCSSGVNQPVREVTARTGSDGIQHVEMVTHSYWFEPNRIIVKAGVPVELRLHNASWIMPHGLHCEASAAGVQIHKNVGLIGRSKTIRFTPTTPGEYPFMCPVDGHVKHGMAGTLVVQG